MSATEENGRPERIPYVDTDHRRIQWERHSDAMRTQIQETGRIRLYFLTLHDLASAMNDLGIDLTHVVFRDGYAVVRDG